MCSKNDHVTDRAIAFHEAGHAYAGIAAGRTLVEVVIDGPGEGRCVWESKGRGLLSKSEEGSDFAQRLFGPLAQIAFVPESVGDLIEVVSVSTIQPLDFYDKHFGVKGWSSDLNFIATPMKLGPRGIAYIERYRRIEAEAKKLLARKSLRGGITALATELEARRSLSNEEVQAIFRPYISPIDDQEIFNSFNLLE